MLNSEAVRNWSIDLSKRARPTEETKLEVAITTAYEIAYGRTPSTGELSEMIAFVEKQSKGRTGNLETAFQDFCHLLLCANEFLYID